MYNKPYEKIPHRLPLWELIFPNWARDPDDYFWGPVFNGDFLRHPDSPMRAGFRYYIPFDTFASLAQSEIWRVHAQAIDGDRAEITGRPQAETTDSDPAAVKLAREVDDLTREDPTTFDVVDQNSHALRNDEVDTFLDFSPRTQQSMHIGDEAVHNIWNDENFIRKAEQNRSPPSQPKSSKSSPLRGNEVP
ncbi:MAG: hypothetical protein Q9224_007095, partial [Gallowayella concinna]